MEDEVVAILGERDTSIGGGWKYRGAFVQTGDVSQYVLVCDGKLEGRDVDWPARVRGERDAVQRFDRKPRRILLVPVEGLRVDCVVLG